LAIITSHPKNAFEIINPVFNCQRTNPLTR